MQATQIAEKGSRLRYALNAVRLLRTAARLRAALKHNPNWHLQPRAPAGQREGGRWTAYLLNAGGPLLPILQRLGPPAIQRLRQAVQKVLPRLRNVPRRWDEALQPREDSYDPETRRISRDSWQRRGVPNVRFRNEEELLRYLGPAGKGRQWHHIVEKRLAGRPGMPAERIHSTDNLISLPTDVHQFISARMSMRYSSFVRNVRRFEIKRLDFEAQYNEGLDLIEEALEKFGYESSRF